MVGFELGKEIVEDVFFAMSRGMKKKILSPYEGESNHKPSDSACDVTKIYIYIYVFLKGIIFLIFIYYVNLGPIAVLCKSGSLISEHFLDIRRTYTNDRE